MTTISPNQGDTPRWPDVFLVEKIPVSSYTTITSMVLLILIFAGLDDCMQINDHRVICFQVARFQSNEVSSDVMPPEAWIIRLIVCCYSPIHCL